jgi:hypothetical protein
MRSDELADEMDTLRETALKYLDILEVWNKMFPREAAHRLQGTRVRRMALCPFHSEKTPSMRIYGSSQRFHCYGCGRDGNVVDLLGLVEGCEISYDRVRQLPAVLQQERIQFFRQTVEEYTGRRVPPRYSFLNT